MTHLQKIDIVIFKAGYEKVGPTPWESLKTINYYEYNVKWDGEKAIISLEKLSVEQIGKRFDPSPTGVPPSVQKKLLEEIKLEKMIIKKQGE
jgi:hypothetical protein